MPEGVPKTDGQEPEKLTRRGFLTGLGAVGIAAVVGGVAYEATKDDGEQNKDQAIPGVIHPWEGRSLEELSWKELTDEIMFNVAREVSMSRLDEVPDPSTRIPQLHELAREELEYFLKPYADMNQTPTHEAVHEELLILRDRIHTGRAEREKRRSEGRVH